MVLDEPGHIVRYQYIGTDMLENRFYKQGEAYEFAKWVENNRIKVATIIEVDGKVVYKRKLV